MKILKEDEVKQMKSTYKKVTAKEAEKIMDRLGLCYGDDGITFYVYAHIFAKSDDGEDLEDECVYEFDSLKERDEFLAFHESKGDEVIR